MYCTEHSLVLSWAPATKDLTVCEKMCDASFSSGSFGLPWPDLNDGLFYSDVVAPSDCGLTLIDFYSTKHKNSAPSPGWLQRIQNGQITIDGMVGKEPNTILRIGAELVYHRFPWREPDAPYLLEILYEDDDMIALNKPSGLQVLPGGLYQQRTVLTQLQWWASRQNFSVTSQGSHPVPVHRLGRGTSGILLCAKTKQAKTCLAAYFADGTSLVEGKRHFADEHPYQHGDYQEENYKDLPSASKWFTQG
uniref:RNA pseudouridine synthase 5 n=1 Tax=Rhizophora mucronata TaxID=61149 RepID=A0A2P2KHL9_RHIMU